MLSRGDLEVSHSQCLSAPGEILKLETLVMSSKPDGISGSLDLNGVWLEFGVMVGRDWVLSAPHRQFSVISKAAENFGPRYNSVM